MLVIVHFFSELPFSTAKGFSIDKLTTILLYFIISLFISTLILKKIKMMYLSLFLSLLISSHIFQKRFENNILKINYVHREYPTFQILKSNTLNYFIFPKKSWNSNKTKRIIKDFTTLYPGKNVMIPLEKLGNN